ncbi:FmdB family zinc ribbon protein [Pseudonocardia abyssalis]|uniref:FmdB family transcriptional regulator n=1 Tax=Pseudonocardia abyssalis TaxID=2792008 RepID=A0ABS6UWJ3_9PSEU|nr:FmdB family zinc ribbon protein [Pseudonocardia abyssalis]MBW0117161.1 FmdB family transcriptional regulator [Pseudonocardia abyssalis]MBW0136621.1 FmdB family transcriptional regulator [Pseudonocardia abyssalis]
MPTYQYACTACDHRFEAVQSFSDASLTVCPECSGALRKVFSSVGIVFKGSGFYRTDSRAGAVPNGDSKPAASSSESSSGEKSGGDKSGGEKKSSESTGTKKDSGSSSTSSAATPAPAAAKG